MSTVGGSVNIIKDDLVLWLDAANLRSYAPLILQNFNATRARFGV